MITEEQSIPTKSPLYRAAEDIFYIQFNDVSFYIEDKNQENFYHSILSNLFTDINIEKIFPLGGKDNVIEHCNACTESKKQIYLVDKDFDDLLNKKIDKENLFYLKRYSIENYLDDRESYIQYIISENPTLNRNLVEADLNMNDILENVLSVLNELILLHFVVQSKCPSLKNISLSYERFVDYNGGIFSLKQDQIDWYKTEIVTELTTIDRRLKLEAQLSKAKRKIPVTSIDHMIEIYPGKYIIKMLKQVIENTYGIASRNFNSFCYRIAFNSNFENLQFLKDEVELHINE